MNEQYIITLIAKKLSGSLDPKEEIKFRELINNSSENERLYKKFQEIWIHGQTEYEGKDSDEVFEGILEHIHSNANKSISAANHKVKERSVFWKIAASVSIIFLVGIGLFIINQRHLVTDTEENNTSYISKSTLKGQKSTILLPDGSKVKLNGESYLEYPSQFVNDQRTVKLVGEAFFEVKENPLKPFIVKSGSVSVKVLGTSFNVNIKPYEPISEVAVVTGKVSVSKGIVNGDDSLLAILTPNEMIQMDIGKDSFKISQFDKEKVVGWKDGILIFDHDEFPTMIRKLESWYGVDFIIENDRLPEDGYTGRYKNASLELIMDGWSYTSNFNYKIENGKVYIK